VTARILALLERDAPDLFKPKPRMPDADTGRLRTEAKQLQHKRDDLARLLVEEILTEAGVRRERKRIDTRLAAIDRELASSDVSDPLPEFRDLDPDVILLDVWDGLGIPRQRAIVRLLYSVTIMPATRRGNQFDPDSVQITRKSAA
jgi:hypothetical protein